MMTNTAKHKTAKQMWNAALAMSPSYLIDKFLDWVEELSIAKTPAQVNGLAYAVPASAQVSGCPQSVPSHTGAELLS